jgi:DUF4097 and DUF4098 domain-containing protein YvlB
MRIIALTGVIVCSPSPSPAAVQRFAFDRTLQVSAPAKLEVTTEHGKIDVVAGAPGRMAVQGDVTVRRGWNVPANAVDLARQVAAAPPIEQRGDTVRLFIPVDDATRRAVTVRYRVEVPTDTEVRSVTNSGATTVRNIAGAVDVRTQSASIVVRDLAGGVQVTTSSGAVLATALKGALAVSTSSSSFTGMNLGSSLQVRTQSGSVDAAFTGNGDADIQTGSSSIQLRGLRGGLSVTTQSGRVVVQGSPRRNWTVTTGSSSIELTFETGDRFDLDAVTGSGSVVVEGGAVQGTSGQRAVKGTVGGGGETVRLNSRSGSIHLRIASR